MVTLKTASQVVAAGQPGPIGKSAYQSAVDNGFVGTEQEWLNSLLPFKGWFDSEESLKAKYPEDPSLANHPIVGDYAYVYNGSENTYIYKCNEDAKWEDSKITVDTSEIQTFATGESVNKIGISTNFDDDTDDDEQLITKGGVRRLLKVTSCNSLGIASTKVIESEFSPVEGVGFKVVMAHRNTLSGTEILMSMNRVVAPVLFEGEGVTTSNTWGDGETIDVFYDGANFIAKRIIGKFKTGEKVASVGIDSTPTSDSGNLLTSGGAKASFDAVDEKIDNLEEEKANKDGYYSQMTVGSAENLVGQTVDKDAYLIRPTGGTENEVANGVASVLGMEGNSAVWNQLLKNSNFTASSTATKSYDSSTDTTSFSEIISNYGYGYIAKSFTAVQGHKYYMSVFYNVPNATIFWVKPSNLSPTPSAVPNIGAGKYSFIQECTSANNSQVLVGYSASEGTTVSGTATKANIIDLTILGIDNLTTVAEVEAWLAQHVGTKPYYAYNAGTILSAQTLGIKTYGQNLLNPTTRQAKLIPYTWENNSNVYTIKNVPSGATATFTPDNTGVAETVDISGGSLDITSYGNGILELSAATADTYVCMKWDEQKDDDVVPYGDHTYDFDARKVYGKNNGVEYQCYPNGMRSADSVHDTLTASEAVVKIGSVDLGNATWRESSKTNVFYIFVNDIRQSSTTPLVINSVKYARSFSVYSSWGEDNYFGTRPSRTEVYFKDMDCTTTQQITAAMQGLKLNYELATPITYTDLIYRDNGIDRPLADVLMNIEVNNWSMEEQLMTPYEDGNPTSIPATIKTQYGMDAVEAIDTLQKTCYFADDVRANLQALLNCINTNCAETLGGTFSIGDPEQDSKVFTFTFTANTEPDVEPTNEGE